MAGEPTIEMLEGLRGDLLEMKRETAAMRREMAEGFATIRKELDAVNTRIEGIGGLIAYHHGQHMRLEERVRKLEDGERTREKG